MEWAEHDIKCRLRAEAGGIGGVAGGGGCSNAGDRGQGQALRRAVCARGHSGAQRTGLTSSVAASRGAGLSAVQDERGGLRARPFGALPTRGITRRKAALLQP